MPTVTRKSSPLDAKIPEACSIESAGVEFLEQQRGWNTDVDATCPKCGVVGESRRMKAKDGSRNARFLWRCAACKGQFTFKVGTIMEDSPIKAHHWCLAFYRAAASKKGVSALQIQGETGLTYKSALFLMHRIRWAMAPANEREAKLSGTVEFDETYVGGKPRYHAAKGRDPKYLGKARDFGHRKTAVVGGVEHDGRVKARVVRSTRAPEMAEIVREMVDTSADLMTDESIIYKLVGQEYASHRRVKHAVGQYVRYTLDGEQVTTNRIEGFWAGLKRQLHGTHHSVSRKHLHRYVSEAEFKYNNRNLSDAGRMVKLIQSCENRRLTYEEQISNRDPETGAFIYGNRAYPKTFSR
ncbi:MAG: IS1595 family transposase [Gemmatimonadaceae bacterium]